MRPSLFINPVVRKSCVSANRENSGHGGLSFVGGKIDKRFPAGVFAMVAKPSRYFTADEYLQAERNAPHRSEFYDGEIFAMVGASEEHVTLMSSLLTELHTQLRGTGCRVFANDMRVKVEATGLYTYPDLVIVCGNRVFEEQHGTTLLNPLVLIEILSHSTEAYDRGAKFRHYRQIPSLQEYVLVSQEERRIERYQRGDEGKWVFSEIAGSEGTLSLIAVPAVLTMARVYEYIEFIESGETIASPV
jgi:Uma2 family endonuclease